MFFRKDFSPELKPFIEKVRLELGLTREVIEVPIIHRSWAEACSCFENVTRVVNEEEGKIRYGWILHLEPYMIIAEFHAIWEKDGIFMDITPDEGRATDRLFIADDVKTFEGERIANVMFNISGNKLIDDYIELNKALFEFMETEDRKKILGWVPLVYEDQIRWDILIYWMGKVLYFYEEGVDSLRFCFCGSELGYDKCHGLFIKKLCNEIEKLKCN